MGVGLNLALLKIISAVTPDFMEFFFWLKGIMIDHDLKIIISTLDFLIHELI